MRTDQTLLVPQPRNQPSTARGPKSTGLPADLQQQAAGRLRAMALLYAVVFFMAGFFQNLLFPDSRAMLVSTPHHWLPGTLSITVALLVAAVAGSARLPVTRLPLVALVFMVASSYGITAAEFFHPPGLNLPGDWIGLSWVGVWILIFTIVVPTNPKRALLAGLAASTSVPVMVAVSMNIWPPLPRRPGAYEFFFAFVFPYLLVVAMSYVGARVIHSLGHEVRKARELGSYQLDERIGAGGMGEVWRARHRLLARPAAIKLIRPLENISIDLIEGAKRRFEREAQAIASLRSPHTVNLFDFGMADDGTFYYVMELLEGMDGERLVKKFGPLPYERVIHVIRQVCHSLSEAESIGLVHRDIKPANIILCKYGEDHDFVKVLDFGIVKAIHEPSQMDAMPTTAATAEHVLQGTPAFIAPEQALGSTVDHRSDIYATGCVAYWLLTGQLVFTGDTAMQLIVQHAQSLPDAPSARTELPIPKELDNIVLACLSKDPRARPQTARELARRLDGVAGGDGWTQERAKRWWEMHQPQLGDQQPGTSDQQPTTI